MRAVALLLLVAFAALSEAHSRNQNGRSKRELLLRSKRRWVLSTIELTEEEPGPYPRKISKMFNDRKYVDEIDRIYVLSGVGVDKEPVGVFSIDQETGDVYVHKSVDREQRELYHIKFDILDKITGIKVDKELAFDVEIQDINDNPPAFDRPRIITDIKEDTPEGILPVRLIATDPDKGNTPNSNVTMRMVSQKPNEPQIGLEMIDKRMAHLRLKGCFNYDKVKTMEIIVEAKDHGTPQLSSSAFVTINVVDKNTYPPVFKDKDNKYQGEVLESTKQRGVLRLAVEDKDTPNTPGWRAKYSIVKGNEGGLFEIETDPNTNEGILNVIKESDFETTKYSTLEISVENEEPLFVCKAGSAGDVKVPPAAAVNVTIKIVDINDPPYFEKATNDVYQREEDVPGKVLFTPVVKDDDSDINNIRYKLLSDPANWMEINKKTGQIKTVKKMDRESPFVNKDGIYNITIGAIDDGDPPATGTCTVLIHLRDINDNTPKLVNNNVILCGNKDDKTTIAAQDSDAPPYSGPFVFSLRDPDGTLKQSWQIKPSVGQEGGLISLQPLPYGNYSVALFIQDQQGIGGNNTVVVTICDCGVTDVCLGPQPLSATPGSSTIGIIFAALLLFLLLLFVFSCEFGNNSFGSIPQDEGNQTLIKYNKEGGGAEIPTTSSILVTSINHGTTTNGQKSVSKEVSETDAMMTDKYSKFYMRQNQLAMGTLGVHQRDTLGSLGGQNMYSSSFYGNRSSMYKDSLRYKAYYNLQSQQHMVEQIDNRLHVIDESHENCLQYQPHQYAFEGKGNSCQSLDKLSMDNLADDLQFLNDLGPKFKTLGNICHEAIKEKDIKL